MFRPRRPITVRDLLDKPYAHGLRGMLQRRQDDRGQERMAAAVKRIGERDA